METGSLFCAGATGRKEKFMKYTETDMEMIKSFAYGYTPEQVADNYGISVEDARNIQKNNAKEIEERKAELTKGGYM